MKMSSKKRNENNALKGSEKGRCHWVSMIKCITIEFESFALKRRIGCNFRRKKQQKMTAQSSIECIGIVSHWLRRANFLKYRSKEDFSLQTHRNESQLSTENITLSFDSNHSIHTRNTQINLQSRSIQFSRSKLLIRWKIINGSGPFWQKYVYHLVNDGLISYTYKIRRYFKWNYAWMFKKSQKKTFVSTSWITQNDCNFVFVIFSINFFFVSSYRLKHDCGCNSVFLIIFGRYVFSSFGKQKKKIILFSYFFLSISFCYWFDWIVSRTSKR